MRPSLRANGTAVRQRQYPQPNGNTNDGHGQSTSSEQSASEGDKVGLVDDRNYYVENHEGKNKHITLKQRLEHFTWAWFTLPMSTGGVATTLAVTPHQFHHLRTAGKFVYILDLVIFVTLCICITARFIMYPKAFARSIKNPTEGLFFATFWICMPNIIGGMQKYGVASCGYWLIVTLRVLFWIYVACTFISACFQYWNLFKAKVLTVQSMTPAWILPIFPVMLSGTIASLIAADQPPYQRLPIIVAGVTFQGLGILVSMLMYAVLIARLFEYGLPAPNLRPGLFIAVGPPSFTALALIGMSTALPENYGYFATNTVAIPALEAVALFVAIFLWALGLWWFAIALVSVLAGSKEMKFHLVWWSFVFPNSGFTIAVIDIGEQLESEGILWVGTAMTIMLVIAWLIVAAFHAHALLTKRMMMPGMDEDKDAEQYVANTWAP